MIVSCANCGKRFKGSPGNRKFKCSGCGNLFTFPETAMAPAQDHILCSNCWSEMKANPDLRACPMCSQKLSTTHGGKAIEESAPPPPPEPPKQQEPPKQEETQQQQEGMQDELLLMQQQLQQQLQQEEQELAGQQPATQQTPVQQPAVQQEEQQVIQQEEQPPSQQEQQSQLDQDIQLEQPDTQQEQQVILQEEQPSVQQEQQQEIQQEVQLEQPETEQQAPPVQLEQPETEQQVPPVQLEQPVQEQPAQEQAQVAAPPPSGGDGGEFRERAEKAEAQVKELEEQLNAFREAAIGALEPLVPEVNRLMQALSDEVAQIQTLVSQARQHLGATAPPPERMMGLAELQKLETAATEMQGRVEAIRATLTTRLQEVLGEPEDAPTQ